MNLPGHPAITQSRVPDNYANDDWRQDSTWVFYWDNTITVWDKIEKDYYRWNSNRQLLSKTTLQWNYTLSEWVNYSRVQKEYQADNTSLLSESVDKWSIPDQTWKQVFYVTYNDDGRKAVYESKSFNTQTNTYNYGDRITYTYNGSETMAMDEILSIPSMVWIYDQRITTLFDSAAYKSTERIESWNDNAQTWEKEDLNTTTFNAGYKPTEYLKQSWNGILGFWQNDMKTVYTYNTSGWLIMEELSVWEVAPLSWKNYSRIIYHYDETGNKTITEFLEWEDATSVWQNSMLSILSYYPDNVTREMQLSRWIPSISGFREIEFHAWNEQGNETEYYTKSVNTQTGEYWQGYRELSVWDTDGLLSRLEQDLNLPDMDWADRTRYTNTRDEHNNLISELTESYQIATQIWKPNSRKDHFYTSLIGIDETPGLQQFCTFRNPLRPGDQISCDNLISYTPGKARYINMQGSIAFEQPVFNTALLIVPNTLSPGLYLLNIQGTSGNQISGRVMIMK